MPTQPKEPYTLLSTYYFPGNVRELQSVVFDTVSKHRSRNLSMETFLFYFGRTAFIQSCQHTAVGARRASSFSPFEPIPTLKDSEKMLIAEAPKRSQESQTIAARLLGISPQALNRRLKERPGRGF